MRKYGKLMSLSEQWAVNCTGPTSAYGNYGCGGGWMGSVFQYAYDNRHTAAASTNAHKWSVDTEAKFPYSVTQSMVGMHIDFIQQI